MFQSTRPRGARPNTMHGSVQYQTFQSTRPRGARRASQEAVAVLRGFNPRAHAGRDHFFDMDIRSYLMFQSTRPRGARHIVTGGFLPDELVSIHAPTRGATKIAQGVKSSYYVSIHAPTRGATSAALSHIDGIPLFQSTRPRGARLISSSVIGWNVLFQSTRPRGARHSRHKRHQDGFAVSIHAPTRGATLSVAPPPTQHSSFNPRAHAGRDINRVRAVVYELCVSIHAPTRGATLEKLDLCAQWLVSIHAPTRGATRASGSG